MITYGQEHIQAGNPCIIGGSSEAGRYGYGWAVGLRGTICNGGTYNVNVKLEDERNVYIHVLDCIPNDPDNAWAENRLEEFDNYERDLPRILRPIHQGALEYSEESVEVIPPSDRTGS